MRVVLVSGGMLEEAAVEELLRTRPFDKLIGIDRGVEFLHTYGFTPDLIVGDFDSLQEEILENYKGKVPIRQFNPEKDATDTEIGIRAAMEMGADDMVILGGTGTRLDHVLANIQILQIPLEQGIEACMLDGHNRIRLLRKGIKLHREHMFGKYISFLPLTQEVTGVSLRGFKYPLDKHTMTGGRSLGVSNEMIADEAEVSLEQGILVMIESRD